MVSELLLKCGYEGSLESAWQGGSSADGFTPLAQVGHELTVFLQVKAILVLL